MAKIAKMSTANNEVNTYFGKCRCCLNYGYLKNMWEEHYWDGGTEIYVEMLVQCFALSWEHSDESMQHDQICETCIKRLRDAHEFKKVILDSQEELLRHVDVISVVGTVESSTSNTEGQNEKKSKTTTISVIDTVESSTPNVEDQKEGKATTTKTGMQIKTESEWKDEIEKLDDCDSDGDDNMYIDDPDDPNYVDPNDPTDGKDPVDPQDPNMEYEEVEYLEDEDSLAGQNPEPTRVRSKTPTQTKPENKWPQRLPKTLRYKTYKQYTEEDLRKCIETVRNREMSCNKAALKYNIPVKTIIAKSKLGPKGIETADPNKTLNKEKMFQLIQEVKLILTYTNATPFKSKANYYYCAYCAAESPYFDDPDELRTHTRTKHATERIQQIEYAMRPHWMNETVKLDIDTLLCTVCCISIVNWNEMFKHLKINHKVNLDQAYTRVIPYSLSNDLKCALCKEGFTNYMHLDGHMNAHYNNYVCDDCGDTFLSVSRLKQHMKIHDVGKFHCSICPKVFTLEKYKKKHEESVHKHLNKFKCKYCEERFAGEYSRHMHLLDKHKEKVKIITCESCGKTFTWKAYYMTHKRKKHSAVPNKHVCPECGKKYFLESQLKEHMLRHTGEKMFPCQLCDKKFISSGSLKHHRNWHKRNPPPVMEPEVVILEPSVSDNTV